MTLALGTCAVIVEERFAAVSEVGCLFSIDMDDQGRVFAVAVVDDDREFVEAVQVTVALELVGDGLDWERIDRAPICVVANGE